MKLARIEAADFLGIKGVDLVLDAPINVICGRNGAGKSSLRDAVALALTADLGRVGLKKEAPALIREGADAAVVEVRDTDGDTFSVSITRAGAINDSQKGRASDPVLQLVLDAQRFAAMDATGRRAFLFALMGVKTDPAEIRARLVTRLFAGRQLSAEEAARVERIAPMLRAGFDAAAKDAKEKATQAKGAWRATTGETYGSEKGKVWRAAVPAFDAGAVAAVATKLKHCETALEGWQRQVGAFEAEAQRRAQLKAKLPALQEVAGRIERLKRKLTTDEATLADVRAQLQAAQAKAGTAPRVGLVHDMAKALTLLMASLPLPGGDAPEWDEAQTVLDRYAAEHGAVLTDLVSDPAAMARLPELERAVATATSAVTNDRRDIAAAEAAEREVGEIEQALAAEVDEAGMAGAVAEAEKLKAERTALQAEADKLRSVKAAVDAAQEKTAAAAKHHADVVGWDAIAQLLLPDGLPAEMLTEALQPFNARLAQTALDTTWPRVEVGADMAITAGGREYRLLSESERWRVDAVLAEAVSHVSNAGLLVLDGMDVLDLPARGELLGWLDVLAETGEIGTALVFATLKAPPSDLPATTRAHWIEHGVAGALKAAA